MVSNNFIYRYNNIMDEVNNQNVLNFCGIYKHPAALSLEFIHWKLTKYGLFNNKCS